MKADFQTFAEDTHRCAMALLHNAAYILKELPAIDLPGPLRSEVTRLCEVWVGIKHGRILTASEYRSAGPV
jgi:hypothetical protein